MILWSCYWCNVPAATDYEDNAQTDYWACAVAWSDVWDQNRQSFAKMLAEKQFKETLASSRQKPEATMVGAASQVRSIATSQVRSMATSQVRSMTDVQMNGSEAETFTFQAEINQVPQPHHQYFLL